ncbi:TniQ family protein [Paraburkholderia youngii]|uniref:TniQ domain-containing protein n=1 Tax=Paraburkholderia youngii TaxID=2782701 RepID=A0A7Y6JW16_9BURK|nr:TniQ family protein [Paraburkholderia youngii]NUX98897.1 hypothetical protein [Paraburkholderia youngii]
MAVYLDEQLDDEPLFGIVARYIETSPGISLSRVIPFLYGAPVTASIMGRNIGHVASETSACWGLAPQEIACRMTIFPYVSNMLEKERASDLLEEMIGSRNARPLTHRLGPWSGAVEFRYCRSCLLEDQKQGIPMHWRRTHQLPGVVICLRHREFLWSYKMRDKHSVSRGFITPETVRKLGVAPLVSDAEHVREEAALEYAQVSNDLLHGVKSINRKSLSVQFSRFLSRRSRYFSGHRTEECTKKLINGCFGKDYFACAGIGPVDGLIRERNLERAGVWKAVLLTSVLQLIERHPDLLADDCFKSIYGDVSLAGVKCGPRFRPRPPVECPSSLAPHGAGHIVERTAWRNRVLQCACECGMTFTCEELDAGIGPPRITRWGRVYVQEVNRLKSMGQGPNAIAEKLRLPLRTVFNMLA